MRYGTNFDAADFTELSQAAIELGLLEAAQTMLDAAFARSNEDWERAVDNALDLIREKARVQLYTPQLTQRQKQLLDLVERD